MSWSVNEWRKKSRREKKYYSKVKQPFNKYPNPNRLSKYGTQLLNWSFLSFGGQSLFYIRIATSYQNTCWPSVCAPKLWSISNNEYFKWKWLLMNILTISIWPITGWTPFFSFNLELMCWYRIYTYTDITYRCKMLKK